MSDLNYLKNIVVVGAGGNIGSHILTSLSSTSRFKITILTRPITISPSTTFLADSTISIKRGDYSSPSFLASVFAGQDALVLALHPVALMHHQTTLIEAAAAAGVKWIIPTEYGTDTANVAITSEVPVNSMKVPSKVLLEKFVKDEKYPHLSWVGLVTGLWFDKCLTEGFFLLDTGNRTARLVDGGKGKFNTTLKRTVGVAISNLLSLPISTPSDSATPSLSDFANRYVYISSFLTSQREILSSVQLATGTTDADWTTENVDGAAYIEEGRKLMKEGAMKGMVNILGGMVLGGGEGADYENVEGKGLANASLGLPEEDFDSVVKELLGKVEKSALEV